MQSSDFESVFQNLAAAQPASGRGKSRLPLGCNWGSNGLRLLLLTPGKSDCFAGRIQPVDATHSLNISAGVWKPSVLRGLSFNCLAIALSWVWEKSERSMPFGMY